MIPKDLIVELDSTTPIVLSQFRDRNGIWAKDPALCVDVRIVFEGGTEYVVSYEDFRTLTTAQQQKVRHAPSSPPA